MDRNIFSYNDLAGSDIGQARKSLWIETFCDAGGVRTKAGQARKSLWIETSFPVLFSVPFDWSGS